MEMIVTKKLSKQYRRGNLLINSMPEIDLTVNQGDAVVIQGKNGSGKSTLLKILATLVRPSSGSCKIKNHDIVKEASQIRPLLGYIPEQIDFDFTMDGIKLWKSLRALRNSEAVIDYFYDLADELRIRSWVEKPIGLYSAGMQKRYMIALWLSMEPEILLLDELDASLDQQGLGQVSDLLQEHDDITILAVSHVSDFTIRSGTKRIEFSDLVSN